ncbi:MAG: hypothetical protein P8I42_02285 [Flavobacteriaceae bacterium]|nr:hypothetical protein [Flavobacteriaceae bacterium]MDG1911635.1 hypothetical protein [Flavobacteriaceae bacterium]
MKHLTFLIYTLHSITFSQFIEQPTQEIDKEYHENGSLKCIKTFKDGKQHGETTFYFDTGQKRIEYHYKEGKLHGQVLWFNHSGQIGWQENYKEGIPEGKWIYYSSEGTQQAVKIFKDGKEISYTVLGKEIRTH